MSPKMVPTFRKNFKSRGKAAADVAVMCLREGVARPKQS